MCCKKQRCLLLPLVLACLAAELSYTATAIGTSTEPKDASTTYEPVIASCNDGNDPMLGDGNNEQAIITGYGQYTGKQKLNVLKHRKDPSKEWQFWMTDYTKNCTHTHFYPDSYEYGSGAEVPLFTGKFKKSIGDGEPYKGKCCYSDTDTPNENALTVGSDVLAGINKVYAFNRKYYQMNGVDEWGTPIEAFTLNKSKARTLAEFGSYRPSAPNDEGTYDTDHRLTHNITFYLSPSAFLLGIAIYSSSAYLETVAHELRHAMQFSAWFDADLKKVTTGDEGRALMEDFAYFYQLAVKNWFKSGEGETLCGSDPCIWTLDEELNAKGIPITNLADPSQDMNQEPYIYFGYKSPQRATIISYAFYAASEGLKKCSVGNPDDEYLQCPAGTSAFIEEDFDGLGIDTAFEIFGYVDQEFEPLKISYKATKGLSLYKADRKWPAKEKEPPYSYLPKETSDTYKVFANAFKAVNVPSDSEDRSGAKLSLNGSSDSVEATKPTIDLQAMASDYWCFAEERFNLRAYVDGVPLEDQSGKPIDIDFKMSREEYSDTATKTFNYSKLPVTVTDESGDLKKDIELDVVLWDIYGADRIVSSKTIPIKGTDPNVKPPEITFKGPSSESPDSSTSDPIYETTLEADAPEGVQLNPDGAYFLFDPGPATVEPIYIEVSEENCSEVSDQRIRCSAEFKVDSRYHEDEGYVQDPDDGGTADDAGEHQDHTAGLSYVEYGSSGEGAPE